VNGRDNDSCQLLLRLMMIIIIIEETHYLMMWSVMMIQGQEWSCLDCHRRDFTQSKGQTVALRS